MDNKSVFEDVEKKFSFYNKDFEHDVDLLIIGGGITGITLSYFLREYRGKVLVIDKGDFGGGVTARTTAKISFLQGTIYQDLLKKFNREKSHLYYQSQKDAISIIKKIISDNHISCDLEEVNSILFTECSENIPKIKKEKMLLESFKEDILDLAGGGIKSGLMARGNYVFHPLKFLYHLVELIQDKVSMAEGVCATSISKSDHGKYNVYTNKGVIKASKVVCCNHYPFFLNPTFIPLKTYVKREYVCVGKAENKSLVSAINIDKELYSIRFYKDYVIYVSHKNRLTDDTCYDNNFQKSKENFKGIFGVEAIYSYINQDVVSNDLLPFIGEVSNNLYIATAYNGWGMTNGVLASKIISSLITYGMHPYKKLFDPNRGNIPLYFSSFVGGFHYAKVYASSLFKKNVPNYIKIKNVLYGVYVDDKGERHMIKLVCPHMKCNLVFNEAECTWDCPCHGSRFSLDGKLLEGPATKSLAKD